MDLLNYNMKVSEIWKEQMIDTLSLIYRDESIEKITNFVNKVYDERYRKAEMDVRNIYQYTTGKVDPDNTLINVFGPKQKLLGANGTLMDNHEENPAPTLILIDILKSDRKVFKAAMLKAKGEGNDDEEAANLRESNAIKIVNNAIYGNQAMEGSLLANIDSAQLITTQAKNETTEMAWNMEKLLNHNLCFESFNECLLYIKNTITIDDVLQGRINEFKHLIDYYPTIEDLKDRYQEMIETAEDPSLFDTSIAYQIIDYLTEDERLLFYYKNNFITFLEKNPKVLDLITEAIVSQSEIDLNEIDKLPRSDPKFKELLLVTNIKEIPEPYKSSADVFIKVMNTFVTNVVPTHERVYKYGKSKRRAIILTDTDSLVLTTRPVVTFFRDRFKDKTDVNSQYFKLKVTMFIGTYLTNVLQQACYMFAKSLNVPERYIPIVDFKNEFYFSRLVIYPKVKKNYVADNIVQEGNLIPINKRISYTGIKTVSGELNPIITKRIKEEIIEKLIVRNEKIDTIEIFKKIKEMQNEVRKEIRMGNKHLGKQIKFRGSGQYGSEILEQAKPRACVTWNRIYPEYEIGMGDTVYYYQTTVLTLSDARKQIHDLSILKKVEDEIFNINKKYKKTKDFSNFGLKFICVPKAGLPDTLPDWLIEIIDIDKLLEDTFKIITELLPGLNLNLSKAKGERRIISPILSF